LWKRYQVRQLCCGLQISNWIYSNFREKVFLYYLLLFLFIFYSTNLILLIYYINIIINIKLNLNFLYYILLLVHVITHTIVFMIAKFAICNFFYLIFPVILFQTDNHLIITLISCLHIFRNMLTGLLFIDIHIDDRYLQILVFRLLAFQVFIVWLTLF
jgi:hypothetical protein